jgi:uncharacterized membrane protein YraQ (UPF0718 family)
VRDTISIDDGASGIPARRMAAAGVLLGVVVVVAALLWAKWMPYAAQAARVSVSHAWPGSSILATGGVHPGDAPTWHAATSFARAYVLAVWKALVAALLISAAIQAFVPRTWLLRVLNRRGPVKAALAGGLLSTPSMMCTCCTAPVASTLRRDGVSTAAALAYWLGNPLLNPAVLAFLFFVAPWQWTVTRAVIGVVLVVGGSALVARLADRQLPAGDVDRLTNGGRDAASASPPTGAERPVRVLGRFARALLRLVVTVLPEYLVVVLLIGAFRGWLFPLGGDPLHSGLLVVLIAAVIGTLLVIPTAGEIPILQGLALAGMSLGGIGALLITLPAVSLPGMVLVGRSFGWRVTLGTACLVTVGGVLAGGLLSLL